jgi:hypothetical protein
MSEITVRRVGAQVIMMLTGDDNKQVEVTLDEAEAATLGSLLLGMPVGPKPTRNIVSQPSAGDMWPAAENAPPFQSVRRRQS